MLAALQAAGAGVSDVVSIETFYVDRGDLAAYGRARRAFFAPRQGPPPASTTVQVAGPVVEGALLEVAVVAVVAEGVAQGSTRSSERSVAPP